MSPQANVPLRFKSAVLLKLPGLFTDCDTLSVQKKRAAEAEADGAAAEPVPKKKKKKAAADTVAETADTLAAVAAAPLPMQVCQALLIVGKPTPTFSPLPFLV